MARLRAAATLVAAACSFSVILLGTTAIRSQTPGNEAIVQANLQAYWANRTAAYQSVTSFSFGVFSDIHMSGNSSAVFNLSQWTNLLTQWQNGGNLFGVVVGDLGYGGTSDPGNVLAGPAAVPMAPPVFYAMGNHEVDGIGKRVWIDALYPGAVASSSWTNVTGLAPGNADHAYWSFNVGTAHFIFLDGDFQTINLNTIYNRQTFGQAQLTWLAADLNANRNKNIFVFVHEPIDEQLGGKTPYYTLEDKGGLIDLLAPLPKQKFIFSGHLHNFGGITQWKGVTSIHVQTQTAAAYPQPPFYGVQVTVNGDQVSLTGAGTSSVTPFDQHPMNQITTATGQQVIPVGGDNGFSCGDTLGKKMTVVGAQNGVAPTDGSLMLRTGGINYYDTYFISEQLLKIQPGMRFSFDIHLSGVANGQDAVAVQPNWYMSAGLLPLPVVDQNGIPLSRRPADGGAYPYNEDLPSLGGRATNQWYHRDFDLSALAGNWVDGVYLAAAAGKVNVGAVYVDNVKFTWPATSTSSFISLTSPIDLSTFAAPATINLAATASSGIARVTFNSNSAVIGSAAAPFVATWSGVPAGSYTITATAPDNTGQWIRSSPASVTVCAAAIAPGALTATPATGVVILSWPATVGAASYNVKRAATSAGPYTTIALGVTATTYLDKTLSLGTVGYYVVTATTSCGTESGNSPQASATPTPPSAGIALDAWSGLQQSGTNASSLTYAFTVGSGLSKSMLLVFVPGYADTTVSVSSITYAGVPLARIRRDANGIHGAYSEVWSLLAPASGANNVVITISGAVGSGNAIYSGAMSFSGVDQANPIDAQAGSIVTGSHGSHSDTMTTVANNAWIVDGLASQNTATAGPGQTQAWSGGSALLERSGGSYRGPISPPGPTAISWSWATSGGASAHSVVSLKPAGPTAPPAAPTNLSATAGDRQVSLSWTASVGATSYKVFRSQTSGGPYTTPIATPGGTTYTDTGLTAGTLYYYVVQAVNASGTSGNSTEASATPFCGTPAAPATLTAVPGPGKVTLNWAAVSGAGSYNVKRSTTSGGGYTTVTSGVTTTTYTDTTVISGTTYYYVVTAVNACGAESGTSPQASATPLPPSGPGIAFDASSGLQQSGTNASSLTYAFTVGSGLSKSMLLVFVPGYADTTVSVSSITYAGVPLARIRRDTNGVHGAYSEIWYLLAPASGANNVVITISGAVGSGNAIYSGAMSFSGVDQANPIDAQAGSIVTGSHGSHSDTITTVANNAWIVDGLASQNTATAGPGQTQQWSGGAAFLERSGGSYRGPMSPPGPTAISWSWATSGGASAHSVVSLKPF